MGVFATFCQLCGMPVQHDHFSDTDEILDEDAKNRGGDDSSSEFTFGPEHEWLRYGVAVATRPEQQGTHVYKGEIHNGSPDCFDAIDVGRGFRDFAAFHEVCWGMLGEPLFWTKVPKGVEAPDESKLWKYRQQLFEFGAFKKAGKAWMLCDPREVSEAGVKSNKRIRKFLDHHELCAAVTAQNIDDVKRKIKTKANLNAKDVSDKTALHYAAIGGNVEIMQLLLKRGAKLLLPSVMFEAIEHNNHDVVAALIAHGANLLADNSVGDTALHYAAWLGRESITTLILDHVDDVNMKNDNGQTPLALAEYAERTNVANLLLERGALKPSVAEQLANFLIRDNLVGFLRILKRGVDCNSRDKDGRTALHLAAIAECNVSVIDRMLHNKFDFAALDNFNASALHYAVFYGHKCVVASLQKAGIDLDILDVENHTALAYAYHLKKTPIVEFLLAHGASPKVGGVDFQEAFICEFDDCHLCGGEKVKPEPTFEVAHSSGGGWRARQIDAP